MATGYAPPPVDASRMPVPASGLPPPPWAPPPVEAGRVTNPDGSETWTNPDGSIHHRSADGKYTVLDPVDGHTLSIDEISERNGQSKTLGGNLSNIAKGAAAGAALPILGPAAFLIPGYGDTLKNGVRSVAEETKNAAAEAAKTVRDATGIDLGGGGGGGTVDTSPISAAAANAKALSDKFLAEYNAAHPGDPPVANAAQLPPAVLAAMPPAIKAGIAVQGAPVVAGQASASLIDPSTGLQFRQGQEGLIGTLNDAISGKAPSVAALQLEQARERNAANQLGLAAKASGGGNTFLALQAAANNTAHINAQAGADSAILRAKEIMDARGQLGGVLDQARGGDVAIGSKNAELGTSTSATNATNTTNANSETARLANAIASGNADRETTANTATGNIVRDILQGNAKAQNDRDLTQGKFTTDTNLQNSKNVLDQRTIDEKSKADLAANALTGSGQQITGTVGAAQAAATAAAAKAQAEAAKYGAYAAAGGKIVDAFT